MERVAIMNKNLEMISVAKLFFNVHYEVPIYQRNYAWEADQIEQLIEDIWSSKGEYFLGNLIVNQKDHNVYEVIDGQQRLTTLYLLERYLEVCFNSDALRFEARKKSNRTLVALSTTDKLSDELQSKEIHLGFKIITDYFEKTDLKNKKAAFIERLNHVQLIRIQVPANIDLNHYFEIMNTRGEQLELHEIAKANFLSKIKSKKDKLIASEIWENCSNMDSYIQMNYSKDKRDKLFTEDWSDLSKKINDFDCLRSYYEDTAEIDGKYSLRDIIENKDNLRQTEKRVEESENERFESILSFPNFLLQVNEVLSRSSHDDDLKLDDKRFLFELKEHWKDECSAKNFLFTLLKARILFDKFILKREYAKDYKESGKWSLQKLEKYKDGNKSKPKYIGTFGDDDKRNKQMRTLQSALRITYTSPKTMHWVSLILSQYMKNFNCDGIQILENYAKSKVEVSGYTNATGFKFERIVFTYLDYILYRDGYAYNGKEIIKPLADDWQFQFRNSIEHFYPQHPKELPKWENEHLNSFGNLALITVSGNSIFNNASPISKVSTNPSILEQSLKLKIMSEMMKQNNNIWDEDLASQHQNEMFEVLKKQLI